MTEKILAVRSDVALKRLEQSRLYWKLAFVKEPTIGAATFGEAIRRHTQTAKAPQYSYVRAVQVSETRVNFTFVSIEGGRAVLRGLGSVDPNRLVDFRGNERKESIRLLREEWTEFGAEVGAHDEGAPALLMDDLYEQCAAEIRRPDAGPIRLYFHPSGVLMHCGRTIAACPHCTTVSIHAYATHSIRPWTREFKASDWSCVEYWGLVLLGAPSWMRGFDVACSPPALARKAAEPTRDISLAQICVIDPSACPVAATFPSLAYGTISNRPYAWQYSSHLGYLDVGKVDPDQQLMAVGLQGEIRSVEYGEKRGVLIGWSKATLRVPE